MAGQSSITMSPLGHPKRLCRETRVLAGLRIVCERIERCCAAAGAMPPSTRTSVVGDRTFLKIWSLASKRSTWFRKRPLFIRGKVLECPHVERWPMRVLTCSLDILFVQLQTRILEASDGSRLRMAWMFQALNRGQRCQAGNRAIIASANPRRILETLGARKLAPQIQLIGRDVTRFCESAESNVSPMHGIAMLEHHRQPTAKLIASCV